MIGSALLLAVAVGGGEACPPAPPRGMVVRSAEFGGVIAPTAADADEAIAAGIVAKRAAKRFWGLDAPPFLITAAPPGLSGGCRFIFPWSFAPVRTGGGRPPSHVLPHEIGHALFIRFLVPKTRNDEYGGDAPDWLDEMAALTLEDTAGVRMRRADTRRHAERGALIPLTRFLAMPHPEWSAHPVSTAQSIGLTISQPRSADTPAFYATARALLDFLICRTGNERVVRLLTERMRAGAPLDKWILAHAARVNAAAGLGELDTEITAFVLTDPNYNEAHSDTVSGKTKLMQKP